MSPDENRPAPLEPLFFEIFESLPRQGPGDAASTARALSMIPHLPVRPRILDLGCGTGKQTLDLAARTTGTIVAVDLHAPFLERLREEASRLGLADRVSTLRADMGDLPFPPASFDLIWAEGSIYNLGLEQGLRTLRPLLRPGGAVALTEVCWLVPHPPPRAAAFFAAEYPDIGSVETNRRRISNAGYRLVGDFPLPSASWWTEYYAPLEQRIQELRGHHTGVSEDLLLLDGLQEEIELFRACPSAYGYVFFIGRAET